jgi:hypothetical protein
VRWRLRPILVPKDACLDPALMLLAGLPEPRCLGRGPVLMIVIVTNNQRLFGRLQGRADGSTRTGR